MLGWLDYHEMKNKMLIVHMHYNLFRRTPLCQPLQVSRFDTKLGSNSSRQPDVRSPRLLVGHHGV